MFPASSSWKYLPIRRELVDVITETGFTGVMIIEFFDVDVMTPSVLRRSIAKGSACREISDRLAAVLFATGLRVNCRSYGSSRSARGTESLETPTALDTSTHSKCTRQH